MFGHFRRWAWSGLWDQALQQMKGYKSKALAMIDSTHVKVHRDGANPAGGQQNQAMSRTKGGLNTKLHAAVDGRCQPQALILTAGTQADVVHAPALLESVEARRVLMDKAYDSDALRELIESKGMKACIPPRSNRVAPAAYDKELYKKRHRVENFFEKIKRMRRIATRYDKTDVSCLASALYSLGINFKTRPKSFYEGGVTHTHKERIKSSGWSWDESLHDFCAASLVGAGNEA